MKLEFAHLKKVNQSYTEHAKESLNYSFKLLVASVKLFAHTIYPDIFQNDASDTCKEVIESGNKKNFVVCEDETDELIDKKEE
jgi:hypothetical protein